MIGQKPLSKLQAAVFPLPLRRFLAACWAVLNGLLSADEPLGIA